MIDRVRLCLLSIYYLRTVRLNDDCDHDTAPRASGEPEWLMIITISMPRPIIITAPLSRSKRKSFYFIDSIGKRCIIPVSAIFLASVGIVVTMMMMMLAMSTSPSDIDSDAGNSGGGGGGDDITVIASTTRHKTEMQSLLRRQESTSLTMAHAAATLLSNKIENDDQAVEARGLTIHTHLGAIHIHFTPELSGRSSMQYILDVVRQSQSTATGESRTKGQRRRRIREVGFTACAECNFYRAESNLLLQGIIADPYTVPTNVVTLGPCPNKNHVTKVHCPEHDPNCGCHGPIMTRGMVGWAGGKGGPDFFINTFVSRCSLLFASTGCFGCV